MNLLTTTRSGRGRRALLGPRAVALALGIAGVLCCLAPAGAVAVPATKVLHYRSYKLVVPRDWPVYRLDVDRHRCVRFDRHAVYLGLPGADQRCPAHAAGRTETILVEPLAAGASRAGAAGGDGTALAVPSRAGAAPTRGSAARLVSPAHGVVVTATWARGPDVIERALGVRTLPSSQVAPRPSSVSRERAAARGARSAARPASGSRSSARAAAASSAPGAVFTGLGFDGCSTPSTSQMSAWNTSPYRAIGVYIGGAEVACSQTNLTSVWMSQETAAGWHMIPIYVGLQAPSNSCGCAAISSSSAASQGSAAASDAVAQAQAVGIGPGNPVYFDMEAYSPGGTNTSTVLMFLGAWTAGLHAAGYKSGVYSSADSGIADLVSQYGTGYAEPDDIWIARWNEARNTTDPNVPATEFAAHQRLHQYDGGHDETHSGVTLNVDGDYLDGATAAAGSGAPAPPPVATTPVLSVSPGADGGISLRPSWSGAAGVSAWLLTAGPTPTSLTPAFSAFSASQGSIVVHSAFAYFAVNAIGSAGQVLGSSPAVATPPHVAIFGNSAFVPRHGLGGLPIGCFSPTPCRVSTTITVGRSTLASTGSENVPVGGGLVYFSLSPGADATVAGARHRRLAVRITVHDISGASASRPLTLIPFTTSGRSPPRSVAQAPALRIIGTTDFVSGGRVGGILAGCFDAAPCHASATIAASGRTIARTSPEFLGVNELGYLIFSLSPTGRRMLARAPGNQLSAKLTIRSAGNTATARIVLAAFS